MISENEERPPVTFANTTAVPMLSKLTAPMAVFTTRKGSIYHMTSETQRESKIQAINLNIGEFFKGPQLELLKKEKLGLLKYLNLESYKTVLSFYSAAAEKKPKGTSEERSVQIFSKGYHRLTLDEYISHTKFINPAIVTSLTELPDFEQGGKKSHLRAAQKSVDFLTEMQKELLDSDIEVFATIFPSKVEKVLENSVSQLISRNPAGYYLMGLDILPEEDRLSQLKQIMELLKEEKKNKPILIASRGEPFETLQAMAYGVYYFEADYPFAAAERTNAITLDASTFDFEAAGAEQFSLESLKGKKASCIHLSDTKHKQVWEPISSNCDCYSCKNHTKGYIQHLIECDEMTAGVLITIHNVAMYTRFLEVAKKALDLNEFNAFANFITSNYTQP